MPFSKRWLEAFAIVGISGALAFPVPAHSPIEFEATSIKINT